ncbi:MAG: acetolactate synthase small subunit [Planctomycetaceae bacterium]
MIKVIGSWQRGKRRHPRKTLEMKHVLSALVMNQPGVLAHISGMLASRAYNIDSLAVGATENPDFSRITFVVNGDEKTLDQVRKQLSKIITVVKVQDFSGHDFVERDLMLIKVSTENGRRGEIRELVDIFRGRIVDVGATHVMIEISGRENKIEAFIERMREFGILEMVRTGRIAMLRDRTITEDSVADELNEAASASAM